MQVISYIATMLLRNDKAPWLPNKSISLNVLAIVAGTAFLAFALAVYDGYKAKVERIIFSLTPHVMVRPAIQFNTDNNEALDDELATCLKVCGAPFAVHISERTRNDVGPERFTNEHLARITGWLGKPENAGISASRVLFEESELIVQMGDFRTEGPRAMRVLGLERLKGTKPAPRIDLTFSDEDVARRFNDGEGILISDTLASEIERATSQDVVPGKSRIGLSAEDGKSVREYLVAGIHRLGIHSISRNLIIAPYSLAVSLIGANAQIGPSYIGLTLTDPMSAKDLARQLRSEIGGTEIAAVAWQSVSDLFDQLELYRWIIYITLGLSILITAINTFVNVNILIMERAQQIGIIRAMGLPPFALMLSFVLVGFGQALIGTVIGYTLGILAGYLLDDYINSMVRDFIPIADARIAPHPAVFLALLAFVTVVSSVTCLIAGRRTLRNDIIENLRST